jgi:DNA-binding CsgD family transcriptional regulator
MSAAGAARSARGKLSRLAHAGLDSFGYRRQAIGHLRAVLPFDAAWWWTIDPASGLFTTGVFEPFPSGDTSGGGLHGDGDYNTFRALARRTGKAGVLSAATGGHLERSDRYVNVLAPLNYEHELRLAQSANSALWGGLALLREPGAPDFTPAETRHIASLGQILTEGLRVGIAQKPAPGGPGMLVIDDDLKILTMTPNAEYWLDELAGGCPGLPDAVRSVAGYLRQFHDGDTSTDRMVRARVRGASGRWLSIHASPVRDTTPGPANTAVIIEEARPSEIAPLIIDAYGLSPREAQVTGLVIRGLSTAEIAAEIHLSRYTVQDHLKAIFIKVGVRSRRELVATIFDQHQAPESEAVTQLEFLAPARPPT